MNYAKVFLTGLGNPTYPSDRLIRRAIARLDREWRSLNHEKRVVVERITDAQGRTEEVTVLRYDRIDQLRIDWTSVNSQTERNLCLSKTKTLLAARHSR